MIPPTTNPPEDDLANMNPSLMTERQQLAFLLRQTAPPKSESSSSESEDSSEEEAQSQEVEQGDEEYQHDLADVRRKKRTKTTDELEREKGNRKKQHREGDKSTSKKQDSHSVEMKQKNVEKGVAGDFKINKVKKEVTKEDTEGCAMCGKSDSPETLFLCRQCDKKYPTQAALGIMS